MNPKKQGFKGRKYCYCKQIKPPKTMKQKLEKSYLLELLKVNVQHVLYEKTETKNIIIYV